MKKSLGGSFTVEATFIMTITIIVIFSIIYLSFYLHDSCRITGLANDALYKAGLLTRHEADVNGSDINYKGINQRGVFYLLFGNTSEEADRMEQYLWRRFSKGLYLIRVKNITVSAGKLKTRITIEAETDIKLPGVKEFFGPGNKLSFYAEGWVHNPAETLRMTEVILDTGSKIRGVDALMDKLKNIGK